jgi:cytochrome c oxidase subunit II
VVARGTGPHRATPARLAGLGVVGVGLSPLLAGCSIGQAFRGFGWPEEGISAQSHQMYDLWIGSAVAALVVGVFVWGLIFWCIVRYRRRSMEIPPQTRYNMPLEFLYTLIPFLVIAVLFYYTAIVQTAVEKRSPNPDVAVEVVAHKWNWRFRYLDAKGADGQPVSTVGADDYIPVLVIPTGKRIRFYETAEDVVHSFWVPDLLFKRDVFPGSIKNEFEVTVDREGAYVGRCAELCGTYHSMMNFEVRVVSPQEYDRFIQLRVAGQSTPEALAAIGEPPTAVTTRPFDTDRGQRS